jgi:hypothetical protein
LKKNGQENNGILQKYMVLGSNLCLFGLINGGVVHVVGSNLSPALGVNGGVANGSGFESLTFGSMVVGSKL